MEKSANVFICQAVKGLNLLPASDFGKPKYLYDGPAINFNVSTVIRQIQKNLQGAQSGDYIVLVGDPVLMGLCSIEIYEATDGNFKFLKWDKQTNKYYPIVIDYSGVPAYDLENVDE